MRCSILFYYFSIIYFLIYLFQYACGCSGVTPKWDRKLKNAQEQAWANRRSQILLIQKNLSKLNGVTRTAHDFLFFFFFKTII